MYKQSPSRNQRSKGIKVKHVLQICLLIAVCFWLIYQVKHSHDKRKEFDEHDAKNSIDSARKDEVVKLGRKDLHPLKEGTVVESDKHGEEVEDEEIEEETAVEEESRHDDEEKENKTEVKAENEERREGVEEEVDDHDQEKSDVEDDREEDFVEEEKDRENDDDQELKDKDSDVTNGQTHTGSDSQEHDDEGGTTRRHEAREENYKADDASSAVTLDTQITSNGNETVVLGKSNEQGEVKNLEPQNNFYHVDGVDAGQSASVNVEGGETTHEGHLGTTTDEKSETTISNSSVTDVSTTHINSTKESGEVPEFSLLNGNGTVSEHNEEQRVVEEHKESSESSKLEISDPKLEDNSTFPGNSDLQDFNSTVSSNSKSSDIENPEDDGESQINESLDELKSEDSSDMEVDTEDSSDSKLSLEEKDVRTDLETLPDIKTEGSNSEDDVAE